MKSPKFIQNNMKQSPSLTSILQNGRQSPKVTFNNNPMTITYPQEQLPAQRATRVRKSNLRPKSAHSPITQPALLSPKSEQDQTQVGNNEESLMETQKPLIQSVMYGEFPEKDHADNLEENSMMEESKVNFNSQSVISSIAPLSPLQQDDENAPETEKVDSSSGPELFVCFSNEKELRDHHSILVKTVMFSGVLIKVKKINDQCMENLLYVIEIGQNIIHLRFEEVVFTRNAATHLSNFMRKHQKLDSLGLIGIRFEDPSDNKKILESIAKNGRIKQLLLQQNVYYDVSLAETFVNILTTNKSIRELDLSWSEFRDKKIFYQLIDNLDNSKIATLKMRGLQVGKVEGKILEMLGGLRICQTLDMSNSYGQQDYFEFLGKFGPACFIKTIIFDTIQSDVTAHMPKLGFCLGQNFSIQNLSLKHFQANTSLQIEFWKNILPNKSLRSLNLEQCKIRDKVIEHISAYIQQDGIRLAEFNLNKNFITGVGIKEFAYALSRNRSIKKLYLGMNQLEEEGLDILAISLMQNRSLREIYLFGNQINDKGLTHLASCLMHNSTLKILDVSKNQIGCQGLSALSNELKRNQGLHTLNLSKNKEISENDQYIGLKSLADCLKENQFLHTIDFTGIKLTKLILKQHYLPALEQNIFVQEFKGKIQHGIINDQLQDNITIEKEIINCMVKEEINQTFHLNMKHKRPELLRPALKLVKCQNIEMVDLTGMTLTDEQMRMLSSFLEDNPPMRRLIISSNQYITDYGMLLLIEALRKNKMLHYLSFMDCSDITGFSTECLYELVKNQNMTLYHVDLDPDLPLSMEIQSESGLNKAIQKDLNPTKRIISQEQHTIEFDTNVLLTNHFESVLKVWRIMRPNYIEVCDQQLNDQDMIKFSKLLLEHLSNVQRIILRRNLIGDEGAAALAKFIEKNEKTFTYLEISRNKISDEGALKILQALKKNTRIQTLLIDFGNQITYKTARRLEREIKSNQLISQIIRSSLAPNSDSFGKLAIKDKGPEFLRCSLKAVSELSIINLELTDNLLSYNEALSIARVLKQNPPLRILNISNNQLDSYSAIEISNALKENTNLIELNLSRNKLGDSGVAIIVLPLAKQKLREVINENHEINTNIRLTKLFLSQNEHTKEALKHVYALLFADKQIVVEINSPPQKVDPNQAQQGTNISGNQIIPLQNSPVKSPKKSMIEQVVKKVGLGRFSKILGVDRAPPVKQRESLPTTFNLNETIMKPFFQTNLLKPPPHAQAQGPTSPGSNSKQSSQELAQKEANQSQLRKSFRSPPAKRSMNQKKSISGEEMVMIEDKTGEILLPQGLINAELNDNEEIKEGELTGINNNDDEEQQNSQVQNKGSAFSVSNFCCGSVQEGKQTFFLKRFLQDLRDNQKDARTFKCNENILTNVESISQRYITIGLYLSAVFFYLTALLIPMTEGDSCKNGHQMSVFFYYAIYAVASGVMEIVFAFYLQKKVDSSDALRINKFHLWKIVSGQLARADFFTDVLFNMQMYSCGYWTLMSIGIVCLVFASIYQIFMLFRLIKKDDNQLLENIERNCKLAYITEHHTLAVILDAFSLSNFQSVNEKTVTIPKIISSIKSLLEDLPQFIIQLVFIFMYSQKMESGITSIVVSILLGLFSFGLSVNHALHAETSNVDLVRVEEKIRERFNEKNPEYELMCEREVDQLQGDLRENLRKLAEYQKKQDKVNDPVSFTNKIAQAESTKTYLLNGRPVKTNDGGLFGGKISAISGFKTSSSQRTLDMQDSTTRRLQSDRERIQQLLSDKKNAFEQFSTANTSKKQATIISALTDKAFGGFTKKK